MFARQSRAVSCFLLLIAGLCLTSAASAATQPDDLPNLKLWLKADAITGIAGGQPVSKWPDSSGSGSDATQSFDSARPIFQASVVNQKPVVSFDGHSQSLGLPSGSIFRDVADFDVFVVLRSTGGDSYSTIFGGGRGGDNPLIGLNQGAMVFYNNLTYPSEFKAPQAVTLNAFHVLEYFKEITDVVLSSDGVVAASGSVRNPASRIDSEYRGIGRGESDSEYLQGDLAELIIYDAALSDPQRADVTCYLAQKYALKVVGCR